MKRMTWARPLIGAAVMATFGLAAQTPALAATPEEDLLGLKMASALSKDRFFVRAGAVYVRVRTKSGDAYDVTGPVITRDELRKVTFDANGNRVAYSGILPPLAGDVPGATVDTSQLNVAITGLTGTASQTNAVVTRLRNAGSGVRLLTEVMMPKAQSDFPDNPATTDAGIPFIGTPPGVKSKAAEEMGTAGLSLGYFFSDDHTWVAEAYVLAAPIRTSAYGAGITRNAVARELFDAALAGEDAPGSVTDDLRDRPNGIAGRKIVDTKLIPPTVMLGRYFGDKKSALRPFLGVNAIYAIFYDTKATNLLNDYVGGSNPGDTTVSIKNAFGIGPTAGLKYQHASGWHASLNVGYTRLKTTATLITRNTYITSRTGVVSDLGPLSAPILASINAYEVNATAGIKNSFAINGGVVGAVSRMLAASRGTGTCGDGGSCLGTYERRQDLTLDNTLFLLSVGRSF